MDKKEKIEFFLMEGKTYMCTKNDKKIETWLIVLIVVY